MLFLGKNAAKLLVYFENYDVNQTKKKSYINTMSFECSGDEADDVYDLNIPLSGITVAEQISLPEISEEGFFTNPKTR